MAGSVAFAGGHGTAIACSQLGDEAGLAAAAQAIVVVLVLQVLLMTLFVIYVVFHVMGSEIKIA